MGNNVTLRHCNEHKSICLDDLDTYQINDVIAIVTRQANKVYYRIYHSYPIPLPAMLRLQHRLAVLLGMLDTITNTLACK